MEHFFWNIIVEKAQIYEYYREEWISIWNWMRKSNFYFDYLTFLSKTQYKINFFQISFHDREFPRNRIMEKEEKSIFIWEKAHAFAMRTAKA